MVDKSDYSWHIPPPTTGNKREFYKLSLDWHHVLPGVITTYRNMKGLQRFVLNQTGRTVDEVSNEEIAKLVIAAVETKKQVAQAKKDKAVAERTRLTSNERETVKRTARNREEKVELNMADYLAFYEAKTANDKHSLRQLCSLEVAIDDLESIENSMLKDLQNPKKAAEISDTYINSIANTRIKYLAEYRQLQLMLGIDRNTRDKRESEQGGTDYMRQLMLASNELLAKKAVKIVCQNCASTGTLLNQGFVLSHFGNWTFESECPKCQSKISLHSP
jgi:hypothetical protein